MASPISPTSSSRPCTGTAVGLAPHCRRTTRRSPGAVTTTAATASHAATGCPRSSSEAASAGTSLVSSLSGRLDVLAKAVAGLEGPLAFAKGSPSLGRLTTSAASLAATGLVGRRRCPNVGGRPVRSLGRSTASFSTSMAFVADVTCCTSVGPACQAVAYATALIGSVGPVDAIAATTAVAFSRSTSAVSLGGTLASAYVVVRGTSPICPSFTTSLGCSTHVTAIGNFCRSRLVASPRSGVPSAAIARTACPGRASRPVKAG